MKKIVFGLFAISLLMACEKDCEVCDGKECDPVSPDSTLICKTDLSKGLLAYYPFNGNFNDESGNGNNATSKNGAFLTTDYLGRTNRSAGFDGSNDYLIVPGSSKLNADTISISLQVIVNNSSRVNTLFSRINFETGAATVFALHESLATDNKWNWAVLSNTEDCAKVSSYDASQAAYSKSPIQPGRWYNITATFANGVQSIYVDGVLHSSLKRNFTTAKKCANADMLIGGWWKNAIISMDGKIDEVRLYNRLLSDCEITKLAEAFKE